MARLISFALCAASAAAFVPTTSSPSTVVMEASLESLPGVGQETGGKPWDPYGFATKASTDTLGWFRHAELKHGRVAMLAFTGFLVQSAGGGVIPFNSANGLATLSTKPFEAAAQTPGGGWAQIALVIGFIELYSESIKPHYTKGGQPGYIPLVAPAGLAENIDIRAANKELKNGRLAMIGMAGFFSSQLIPGSVPWLDGISL